MTPSFLAVGECMIELADMGQNSYKRGFAGDTFNTAWYARKLLPKAWDVSFGSCIGDDLASQDMAAFVRDSGIATDWLRIVPKRSVGLYMITLDHGERRFSYWRSQSAARLLADDADWLAQMCKDRAVIHFSGITLAILSPRGREALCAALEQAKADGAMIAFDTNLRPNLWDSHDDMRDWISFAAQTAQVVLPSFDEDAELFGDKSPTDTIARYQSAGAELVAVKNGGDALWLWDETGIRTCQPVPIDTIVDTTAAGDSFAAAFLSALALGQNADDAAMSAMQLASTVIQHRGALVPSLFKG